MNVNYFGYYLHDQATGQSYRADLRALIAHFASKHTIDFKKTLTYNGEPIYPVEFVAPTYFFIQARDREVIKHVERASLDHADMADVIGVDNAVGFASYVYMGDCWLGIATKVLSPRITAFAFAVNEFLKHLGSNLEFRVRVFTEQLDKARVATLDHVGAVTIDLQVQGNVGRDLIQLLSGNGTPAFQDIGELEIRITPALRKSNLRPLLQDIINGVPEDQINELDARARVEAADRTKDVFIVGAGGLRDTITVDNERQIPEAMNERSVNNRLLEQKVQEFKNDANFQQANSLRDLNINW